MHASACRRVRPTATPPTGDSRDRDNPSRVSRASSREAENDFVLNAPQLPACGVDEGPEGEQLRQVIGSGWILGIPVMFAMSLFVLFLATHSVVWTLLVAAWG